jgi:hypothetical protein
MAVSSLILMPPVYRLSQPIGKVEEGQPTNDPNDQKDVDDLHPSNDPVPNFAPGGGGHHMHLSSGKVL